MKKICIIPVLIFMLLILTSCFSTRLDLFTISLVEDRFYYADNDPVFYMDKEITYFTIELTSMNKTVLEKDEFEKNTMGDFSKDEIELYEIYLYIGFDGQAPIYYDLTFEGRANPGRSNAYKFTIESFTSSNYPIYIVLDLNQNKSNELKEIRVDIKDNETVGPDKKGASFRVTCENKITYQSQPFSSHLDNDQEIMLISTKEELELYIDRINQLGLDEDYLDKYNYYLNSVLEKSYFFSYKVLILIDLALSSTDIRISVNSIETIDNNLNVIIDKLIPEVGDTAIQVWGTLIEVNTNGVDYDSVSYEYNEVTDSSKFYIKSYSYNFQYFNDEESKFTIKDYESLEDYIELVMNYDGGYNYQGKTLYINHLRKYDEVFFNSNSLIIINYNAGSGSALINYKGFRIEDNNLIVFLNYYMPSMGTDDEKPWNFIFEVSNELEFEDFEFKLKVNNMK